MNGESKIVFFEKWQRESEKRNQDKKIFTGCRSILIAGVAERLARLRVALDGELLKLSGQADNEAVQAYYINNIQYFRREWQTLQERSLRELGKACDVFWQEGRRSPKVGQGTLSAMFSMRPLIAEEMLEGVMHGLIEKANGAFASGLYALEKHLVVLCGISQEEMWVTPVSPFVLCRTFAAALDQLTPVVDFDIKLLVYKLFDRQVLLTLGPVYRELLAYMGGARVLAAPTKGGGAGSMQGKSTIMPTMPEPCQKSGKYQSGLAVHPRQTVGNTRFFVDTWRELPSSSAQMPARKGKSAAVDAGGGAEDRESHVNPRKRLKGSNILFLKQTRHLLLASPSARFQGSGSWTADQQTESPIKSVGLIFFAILEDNALPAPIKAALAKLQIPVLKIAVEDKSLLEQANHPVRLLLNCLAQAGLGLSSRPYAENNRVSQEIQAVVHRAVRESCRGSPLFYDLLGDFVAFMACEHRKAREVQKRIRQLAQSREQIQQAEKVVGCIITSRLRGKAFPAALKSFVCDVWKDVMLLAWLQRNSNPRSWNASVNLADDLIASMLYLPRSVARERCSPQMPLVINNVKRYLEKVESDPLWKREIYQELESCYNVCRCEGPVVTWVSDEYSMVRTDVDEFCFADFFGDSLNVLRHNEALGW